MIAVVSIVGSLLFLAVAVILGLAATKPSIFRVERSAPIQAPAERIHPRLADFREWMRWSPWEKVDPALERSYSGAERGVGAVYDWKGPKAGQGRMEVLASKPPSDLEIKLDFIKPFEAHNLVRFALRPEGAGTRVTWSMEGPSPFAQKVMCVFVDLDKTIGKDFEAGLANLKALAEA
jgi:hypothetical protein